MKRFAKLIAFLFAVMLMCVAGCNGCTGCNGCNKAVWGDGIYQFDYAIIKLPTGELVEGAVEQWGDYEGEQLQIKIDGVWYLTSDINCVLIANGGAAE